ncbi:MAG TPA: hypothetical protein VL328_14935 [Gemmatimonadaceae bacterium]|jgi:hypothetical protein|nr:hypothetical protein [Gemmatimonadaceae bacterium]
MLRSIESYVPSDSVEVTRHGGVTVLAAAHTGERWPLTPAGEEVWTLLQSERRTVDRLVIAMARRSGEYALPDLPDLVRAELNHFVERGFVQRVAEA